MATRRTKPADSDTDGEQSDQSSDDTTAADEANGDGGTDDNGLEGRIREIVREVVSPLLDHGSSNGRGPVDDEDSMTGRVRDALAKVKAEEDRDSRFKKVEETLQRVTERAPARSGVIGNIQRWMWGDTE
jgi:hypothetical protein